MQFTGFNHGDIFGFCPDASNAAVDAPADMNAVSNQLWIKTLEGGHIASPGDWIIRGVKGEFYPCKPDIFASTYDPA